MRTALLALLCALPACKPAPVAHPPPPPPTTPTAAAATPPAPAKPAVTVRFLQRDARDQPWRPITDEARLTDLRAKIDNEPARFALALYAEAWKVAPPPELPEPTLFIGIEEGGNHNEVGLTLADGTRWPEVPYLRLADDPDTLRGTLLHETGHAIHALLARGAPAAGDTTVASIPHSTAAVTDRRTALNEGLAIHLEAVNAHCGTDPQTRAFYDHEPLSHEPANDPKGEYFFPLRDLMTYAQTFARYQMVRDNMYAFESAKRGDYLAIQLDPARDLREHRNPGSLIASEGFVASVLFQYMLREGCGEGLMDLVPLYRDLWKELHRAETTTGKLDAIPVLDLAAEAGPRMVDVFLDLSHGITVERSIYMTWAQLYDASLTLDIVKRKEIIERLEVLRRRWHSIAEADPYLITLRIGPVVPVVMTTRKVRIVAFGDDEIPVSFDVNACGLAMFELVPGWSARDAAVVWMERERAPFHDWADFQTRLKKIKVATPTLQDATAAH